MSRLTRGLWALSCLVVLVWSVNVVTALNTFGPSSRSIDQLESSYESATGFALAGDELTPRSSTNDLGGGSATTNRLNSENSTAATGGATSNMAAPLPVPSVATTIPPGPAPQAATPAPPVPVTTPPVATTATTIPQPTVPVGAPPGVIPATIPHPGINGQNGYGIGLIAKDPRRGLWRAPYLYQVPYASDTGWLAGDRVGYGCAYGFLQQQGEIVGRFTFRRIESASYVVVNDSYMDEGARYYDGSPTPPGTVQVPAFECPATDQPYEPADVPDERPVIVFWSGAGQALEIRDYRPLVPGPGVTFEVVEIITQPFQVTSSASGTHTVNSRVTVLARENGVPVVVVYYDGLGVGQVTT